MYADYFGLKEASFSITPDPHYLYLSQRHREALAHLLYGADGNGGFVQLTGEVGTGKTTICRAFMEQVPEQVDLALILNPALTVMELLQAICQEFHIPKVQDETSRMVLVDKLNRYLLKAHANGRRPVLMIDEAQNLSPDVLEQLRLLTNLETSKHKLLQIFLIGQPELQEMLQRQELRQLAQRITARYHLTPLSEAETADYIRHRLAVAEVERPLFSRSALRQIHKLSGGVPRLINMLCDRALLGAFATHRQTVDASIVKKAAAELQGAQPETGSSWRWLWWLPLTLVLLAALTWAFMRWQDIAVAWQADETEKVPQTVETEAPAPTPPIQVSEPAMTEIPAALPEPAASVSPAVNVEDLLLDRPTAFNLLLGLWQKADLQISTGDPCQEVITQGLRCHQARGTWNNIRHYRHPALLELKSSSGTAYVLVTGLKQQTAVLKVNDGEHEVPFGQLESYWFGDFTLLWQPPPTGNTLISSQSSLESVQWLKQQLADTGYTDEHQTLAEQIQAFQLAEALKPDGIAGPNTLIHLSSRADSPAIPRLRLEYQQDYVSD